MEDRLVQQRDVVGVDSGDCVTKVNRNAIGQAGRQTEHPSFATRTGQGAVVQGSDGGLPGYVCQLGSVSNPPPVLMKVAVKSLRRSQCRWSMSSSAAASRGVDVPGLSTQGRGQCNG